MLLSEGMSVWCGDGTSNVLQLLFTELDAKLQQATSLLTRAVSSQNRCAADT